MKYLITYEKRGRHGLFPSTSTQTIEAENIIQATLIAKQAANDNERVKSVLVIA